MSESSNPFSAARIRLNKQVISILNLHESFWNPCCGPVEGLNGTTFAVLLQDLQNRYTGWTAALLQSVLQEGRNQGRYKVIGSNRAWYLNQSAQRVNQRNKVYDSSTNAFCDPWTPELRYGIL